MQRVEDAAKFAAWILENEQKNVFPAACVDMAVRKYQTKPNSPEWWEQNMQVFMQPSEACYVLRLEGWESSSGVKLEMSIAEKLGKPIYHYTATEQGYQRV